MFQPTPRDWVPAVASAEFTNMTLKWRRYGAPPTALRKPRQQTEIVLHRSLPAAFTPVGSPWEQAVSTTILIVERKLSRDLGFAAPPQTKHQFAGAPRMFAFIFESRQNATGKLEQKNITVRAQQVHFLFPFTHWTRHCVWMCMYSLTQYRHGRSMSTPVLLTCVNGLVKKLFR